jgi:hypothetical protein
MLTKATSVWQIVDMKYERYVAEVVTAIKGLSDDARQSGDDGLDNVWEEWKLQVQRGEAVDYDAYERTIRDLCERLVEELPRDEQALLWFGSNRFWTTTADRLPPGEDLVSAVADEVFQRVSDFAADDPLLEDPDEAIEREAYEDDRDP